jgi:amino acid permease
MQTVVNLWPLIGVLVIVVGFVLRFNPLLVVTAAAIATGFAAHFPWKKSSPPWAMASCRLAPCN